MNETDHPRLRDVATFIRGITFKPDDVVRLGTAGAIACMRTKNVQSTLDLSDVWAIPHSLVKRPDQRLRAGDILVSSANSWNLVGKCCAVPELPWESTFGGFVSVLRGDKNQIDDRYLLHWFASPRIQATVRSFGQQTTNISNLNADRCLDLHLPLASLPEQRRIADILDKADALRSERRRALALFDDLPHAIFHETFGDRANVNRRLPMSTVAAVSSQVTDGEHLTPRRAPFGVKLLSARNIRDGWIDFQIVDYVDEDEYTRIRRRCDPTLGDLLISCSGTIGRVAQVRSEEHLALVRSVALVRPNADVMDSTFLEYWLRTAKMLAQMRSRANASSQANLFQGQIRDLPVPVPPIRIQKRFAERVEQVDRLRVQYRSSLAHLDALFASLRHRAFSGQL